MLFSSLLIIGCNQSPQSQTSAIELIRTSITPQEAKAIATEAYIFGASYVDNYRVYIKAPIDERHPLPVRWNEFLHLRELVGPEIGDTPNNDALFSYSILDLRREPVVISVPEVSDDRLYMMQIGEANTNTLPYISSIATGTGAGDYVVVGPDFTGYLPAERFNGIIVSRGQFAAVTGRTAIDGPEDLLAVMAIQDAYKITPLSRFLGQEPPADVAPLDFLPWDDEKARGIGFFDYMNMTFAWQLPTLEEMPMLERFARIGVIPGARFNVDGLPDEIVAALQAGMEDAREAIAERSKTLLPDVGGGWIFGTKDTSRVGGDYLLRAAVSSDTIYPNAPDHAVYAMARKDADGSALSGNSTYVIAFDAGELPPVDNFWSLTIYDAKTTAMVPNELKRYSIGDRTEGLVFGSDGSLKICVQSEASDDPDCNWLPGPEGDFYLVLRLYGAKPEVAAGKWTPPPVTKK